MILFKTENYKKTLLACLRGIALGMSDEVNYKIEYEKDEETGQIVATIPELNHLSSFGDSFAEAEANVR